MNSFKRQHQKLKRKGKIRNQLLCTRVEQWRSEAAQTRLQLRFSVASRQPAACAALSPAAEKRFPLLSLVLNGVCVSLQLCMVLCLIILHHFYPIQSYLM